MLLEGELLTSAEVARLLRVHPKHLYRLLRQGLPGHRVGRGHWRFRRSEVLAWFGDRRTKAQTERGELDATLAPGDPLRAGSQRVVLGRVRDRWVAHPLNDRSTRSADALITLEAPRPRADPQVRARPLDPRADARANLLVAGCAPVLGLILDRIERGGSARIHWLPTSSGAALQQVAEGFVHVAGIHLEDPDTGTDHAALVRERFAKPRPRVIRLLRWRTGLVLHPSDERRSLDDLLEPSVRWIVRDPGAGAQRVLERVIGRLGASVEQFGVTRVATHHREVAQAVALGAGDVGVTIEAVAREAGLRFVPLTEEGFDLVVPEDLAAERPLARMLEALDDPILRREIGALGTYDTSMMGHATTP